MIGDDSAKEVAFILLLGSTMETLIDLSFAGVGAFEAVHDFAWLLTEPTSSWRTQTHFPRPSDMPQIQEHLKQPPRSLC